MDTLCLLVPAIAVFLSLVAIAETHEEHKRNQRLLLENVSLETKILACENELKACYKAMNNLVKTKTGVSKND